MPIRIHLQCVRDRRGVPQYVLSTAVPAGHPRPRTPGPAPARDDADDAPVTVTGASRSESEHALPCGVDVVSPAVPCHGDSDLWGGDVEWPAVLGEPWVRSDDAAPADLLADMMLYESSGDAMPLGS